MNAAEFCQGFFHVDESREWNQEITCLCASESKEVEVCKKMTVHAIGHVWIISEQEKTGKTLFLKKYQNQYKGDSNSNVHCEELIRADTELLNCVASKKASNTKMMLTLYISYQPCHQSAGGRNLQGKHQKSCTNILLQWWLNFLKPMKVVFRIKCCNIYRAHWEDTSMFDNNQDVAIFYERTQNARNGLQILIKNGILMQSMNQSDWWFLLTQCCSRVNYPFITREKWEKRKMCDAHIKTFLHKISHSSTC